jgi:hypothetical protein
MTRAELIGTHDVLSSTGRGVLVFNHPGMAEWVRSQRHRIVRRHEPPALDPGATEIGPDIDR